MKQLPGSSLSFSILYSTSGHCEIKISWWLSGSAPQGLQDRETAGRRRRKCINKAAQSCSLTSSSPFLPFHRSGEGRAELPWQRKEKKGFSFTFQSQTLHVGRKKGTSLCSVGFLVPLSPPWWSHPSVGPPQAAVL